MKPIKQPARWDGVEELRKAIERTDELRALYAKLGYSPYVERESRRIVNELKSLVSAEISDFAYFREYALELQKPKPGRRSPEPDEKEFYDTVAEIVGEGDHQRLSEFVRNKPFEIPYMYEGLVRGRASDPQRFNKLLDQLERLLKDLFRDAMGQCSTLGSELRFGFQQVRECVAQDGRGDLANALNKLGRVVELACNLEYDDDAREKREQLNKLLSNSLRVRDAGGQDDADWHREPEKQAKTYLDSTWMHTPWLTTRILTDLLDVELAPLSREAKSPRERSELARLMPFTAQVLPEPWATLVPAFLSLLFLIASGVGIYFLFSIGLRWVGWLWIAYLGWHYYWRFRRQHALAKGQGELANLAARLERVRDEVDSGNYDPEEIARRLRRHEQAGLHVHSLTYALLRLNRSGDEKERSLPGPAEFNGPLSQPDANHRS